MNPSDARHVLAARALAGQTILITGAGSGIGRVTAQMAGAAGATVACVDVRGAADTAATIDAAVAYRVDVQDRAGWTDTVDSLLLKHGRIDALCNVAGVLARGTDSVEDLTDEDWSRVIDVNLKGCWLGMQAICPLMARRGGGRVVNIASVAGMVGIPRLLAYSASKMGIIGMSRSAAVEYAHRGVRINVIAPGTIEPSANLGRHQSFFEAARAATPIGRLGRPEEIANMCLYLLGPGGDFMTGSVLTIDGGYCAQ